MEITEIQIMFFIGFVYGYFMWIAIQSFKYYLDHYQDRAIVRAQTKSLKLTKTILSDSSKSITSARGLKFTLFKKPAPIFYDVNGQPIQKQESISPPIYHNMNSDTSAVVNIKTPPPDLVHTPIPVVEETPEPIVTQPPKEYTEVADYTMTAYCMRCKDRVSLIKAKLTTPVGHRNRFVIGTCSQCGGGVSNPIRREVVQ